MEAKNNRAAGISAVQSTLFRSVDDLKKGGGGGTAMCGFRSGLRRHIRSKCESINSIPIWQLGCTAERFEENARTQN